MADCSPRITGSLPGLHKFGCRMLPGMSSGPFAGSGEQQLSPELRMLLLEESIRGLRRITARQIRRVRRRRTVLFIVLAALVVVSLVSLLGHGGHGGYSALTTVLIPLGGVVAGLGSGFVTRHIGAAYAVSRERQLEILLTGELARTEIMLAQRRAWLSSRESAANELFDWRTIGDFSDTDDEQLILGLPGLPEMSVHTRDSGVA